MDLARLLRTHCGHDSRTVPGCVDCEAADGLEDLAQLMRTRAELEEALANARALARQTDQRLGRLQDILRDTLGHLSVTRDERDQARAKLAQAEIRADYSDKVRAVAETLAQERNTANAALRAHLDELRGRLDLVAARQ